MKKNLKKFIENQIGFKAKAVNTAIDKYFEIHPDKHMYVHETHQMSMSNGELYLYGDFGTIVWNCESLFLDLPHIMGYALKARTTTDEQIKDQLLSLLEEFKIELHK
jgi:NAD-dependent oxidoreductase involved in siderophore biosynthesis